ncbi:MAG: hypothetical protein EAZ18_01410 [Oscillatoriales cyanobacterium]|nr:MAG: hypothetical protein EAZ18_01410 [Oscillatoriales cyanobacterium]
MFALGKLSHRIGNFCCFFTDIWHFCDRAVSSLRSPLAPLKKGGTRSCSCVPLLKGDLGGSPGN